MGTPASHSITFAVRGPIDRADLAGLSDRVCALFTANPNARVGCDVRGVTADAVTVEALARLQLAAHRAGCEVRLINASHDLLDLVELMGLRDVLPG